jgi:hypothetical protein
MTPIPRPVAAGEDVPPPAMAGEIPRHGLAEPGFEGLKRTLSELAPALRGIDRVFAVVAVPAGDEIAQLPARSPRRGLHGVKQVADRGNDVEVRALVAAADIAGLADDAALADDAKGVRVMLHIEPRSSRRHRPAASRARGAHDDHVRDQLLREVIGPVTVGTVVNTVE